MSFLWSLDNILLKNVVVSFLEIKFQMELIWKKNGYFWPTFHIFSHQGKETKIILAHIPLTYIHTHILLTLLTFFAFPIFKNYEFIMYGFSLVWLLVLILSRAILERSINNKMVSKICGNVYYWYLFTLKENP